MGQNSRTGISSPRDAKSVNISTSALFDSENLALKSVQTPKISVQRL